MVFSGQLPRGNGSRKAILDLSPLELDCMNALWTLGEGTVRQIQQSLIAFRPRAYTTIMTIMDRLAQKGVVTRHKVSRAYLYRPQLTAEEARTDAVERLVEGFFEGSAKALAAHLAGSFTPPVREGGQESAAGMTRQTARRVAWESSEGAARRADDSAEASETFPSPRLDESLL